MATADRAKGHHKVPRFYLDGFTDPTFGTGAKSKLWVYRFGQARPFSAKPSKVAFETHFNSIITSTGERDPEPEEYLGIMDGKIAELWPAVLNPKHTLTDDERTKVALFIGFIFTRTSWKRMRVDTVTDKSIRMAFSIMAADYDSLDPKAKQELTREEILRAADTEGIFKASQNAHVQGVFQGVFDLAEIVYNMKWTFLHVQDDNRLIASDHPLSMVNADIDETQFGVGLTQQKVEVMLPLDQTCALFMSWEGPEKRLPMTPFLVEQANARTIRWAMDEVYSPGRFEWLDDYMTGSPPQTEEGDPSTSNQGCSRSEQPL